MRSMIKNKRTALSVLLVISVLLASLFAGCSPDEKSSVSSPLNSNSASDLSSNPESAPTSSEGSHSDQKPSEEKTGIPLVYIETESKAPVPDNKEEVRCSVDLEFQKENFSASGLSATIQCRGNGSLEVARKYGKYPYKIEFDKKENPFDLGEYPNRDWVLIPNRGDRTMLRNFAAKRLGEMLGGITCSPKFLAVSLFVNGEYEGVYELTEQIEAAKGRVPVDDGLTGDENGFLIELDRYARKPEEGDITFGVGKNLYTVKSDVNNSRQLDNIKECVNKVDAAVYLGDENTFCQLVDIDSAVDMYLLQEFAKNIDAGFSSFYMYKNVGGKLYFSPPWDFDLAFGNDRRLDEGSPEGLYVAEGRKDFVQNHLWYIELCKNNWFISRAKARWKEICENEITKIISETEQMAEYLSEDMEVNFHRWPEFSVQLHQEPDHTLKFTTYKEHTDYLIDWMKERKAFLNTIYG